MINLKIKTVITGATGGIGNSIIEKFYNQGAKIFGTGTNDETRRPKKIFKELLYKNLIYQNMKK